MRSRRLASLTGRRAALLWVAAAVILAAAFAIRLAYVDATPGMKLVNDALDYDGHAVSIATVGHYSDTLAYGRQTLWVLGRFLAHRRGLRWTLLCDPAAWRR